MSGTYQYAERVGPARRAAPDYASSKGIAYPAVPALQKKDPEELKTHVTTPLIGISENNVSQTAVSQLKKTVQFVRKKRKKSDDDDDGWLPPGERRKHRQTFSKKIRKKVIKKHALRNKRGLFVCPGCGMPLADKKLREIKTYYISKSGKRHNIVSAQLDHYPRWAGRLEALKRRKSTDAQIREDPDDVNRLRVLCLRCNASHKFEKQKTLPDEGYSDSEYFSDDDERDKEIWKSYRKDDDDGGGGNGTSLVS
ncbi:MAG TPA: hypothetical protein VFX43_10470 [Chitinophagaceae bacterium]|nr:hypothetical protein [Chitinophagaceae bacterium]